MGLTIYREIKLLKDDIDKLPNSELRKGVLDSLIEYIKSSGFYKSRNFDSFVQYMELPDEKIASILGIRKDLVRTLKSRSTKAFYSIFPSNIFTIIRDGSERELQNLQRVLDILSLSLKSTELFPSLILEDIGYSDNGKTPKKKEFSAYSFSECANEIKFLRQHSFSQVRQQLRNLDLEKIKFLLRLIDGQESSSRYVERARLLDYLTLVSQDEGSQGTL